MRFGVAGSRGPAVGVSVVSSAASATQRRFRVVVAGSGVAALEAALALRELAGERVALTMATPASVFTYRPLAVMRPFQAALSYRLELGRIAADLDARLVPEAVVAVDADRQRLRLAGGRQLGYDALLVAIGARAEALLTGGTLTPWDWGEGHAFRSLLGSLTDGRTRRVAFIVPAGLTWPLPLYELALLTSAYLRERAIRGVSLQLISAEPAPLGVFGPAASRAVAGLLEQRDIVLTIGQETRAVEDGLVRTAGGSTFVADATVALPLIQSRPLPGVSVDAAGFIIVDRFCRALGSGNVFAAGDCTDQPLKQGGLAAQQADAAAAGIAALAGAPVSPTPFRPTLEAVLLTGETPLHLDSSGARPLRTDNEDTTDRGRREKFFAHFLTPYLTRATPPLPRLDRQ